MNWDKNIRTNKREKMKDVELWYMNSSKANSWENADDEEIVVGEIRNLHIQSICQMQFLLFLLRSCWGRALQGLMVFR